MELDDSEDRSDGVDFEQGCTEDAQGSCRWREGNSEVVATVEEFLATAISDPPHILIRSQSEEMLESFEPPDLGVSVLGSADGVAYWACRLPKSTPRGLRLR